MIEIHSRKSGQPSFLCCNERLTFNSYISCSDHEETSEMKCLKCNEHYIEEVILGQQYDKWGTQTDYPRYTIFKKY